MKKLFLGFFLALLSTVPVVAQDASTYLFNRDMNTEYAALSGEGVKTLAKSAEVKGENFRGTFFNETEGTFYRGSKFSMSGIDIGFDFYFEGEPCSKFIACGAGFIMLLPKGENETIIGDKNPNIFTYGWERTIGAAVDPSVIGVEGTQIRYKLEGSEAQKNRVLTVEFTGLTHEASETAGKFNFQIKLHETTNLIELFFGNYYAPYSTSSEWGIGIEGVDGKRLRIGAANGGTLNRGMWINGEALANINNFDGTGTSFQGRERFEFKAPASPVCQAPDKTVTSVMPQLLAESTNLAIMLSATGTADAYLIVASKEKENYTLENGRTYRVGDAISKGTVIAVGDNNPNTNSSIMASHTGLEPKTEYYYSIFLYNYLQCTGGPIYGAAYDYSVTSGGTLPPENLRVVSISDNDITLSVTANQWNDSVLIACSNLDLSDQFEDEYGKPKGDMKVGDTLWYNNRFGGKLIYKGLASQNITYSTPVPAYTPYFFIAYSRTEKGAYSASYILTDTVSLAKLPFKEDFSTMRKYKVPCGWYGTSAEYLIGERATYYFVGTTMTMKETNSDSVYTANLVLPTMALPADRDVRLVFEYNMNWNFTDNLDAVQRTTRADWHENDSIVFEVSADGGRTYKPAYVITRQNADEFASDGEYKQKKIAIKDFRGINAKLRIRYVAQNNGKKYLNTINFRNFEVVALDECDYPALVQVIDSTIKADRATVRWASGAHNETRWNLSYALRQADGTPGEWSQPVEVTGNSYNLVDLKPNRRYSVRMQAVCKVGSVSEWVSSNFTSGLASPFVERFNDLDPYYWHEALYYWNMPFGWTMAQQNGSSEPSSLVFDQMTSKRLMFDNWKKGEGLTPYSLKPEEAAAVIPLSMETGTTYVLRLPEVSVRAEEHPTLVFDYAYGLMQLDGEGNYGFEEADVTLRECFDKLVVWVSTDGGNTFKMDSAVRTFEYKELAENGDSAHIEIPLDAYNGNIRIAFGVHTVLSVYDLFLDNIGVVYKCPAAQHLDIRAGSLTENSVTLDWWEDPTLDSWKVICRGNGTETTQTVQGSSLSFDNLEKATNYTVLVGQDCADTSAWSRVSFKTGGAPCDPVSGITVSEVTKSTAKLQWTGSAEKYRIRIRPVGGKSYTYYEAETNSFVLQNLDAVTTYEGGVQSVCGLAVGDTANYVAFENFTTLDITCFAPTDIEIVEKNHYSAVVKWKGTTDKYQVEYRLVEDLLAESVRIIATEASAKMDNLLAETLYNVRVRSICSANDTSAWSDWTEFSTATAPACPEPSNLRAETTTATTARLVWSTPEEGAAFALRYSLASPVSWNNVEGVSDTTYELKDLKPETMYLWSVMSVCRGGKKSDWAQRASFRTQNNTAVETNGESKFSVYAGKGQLHVLNPSSLYIERIRIYTLDGRYTDYPVRSDDNVLITTRLSSCVVIVEVQSAGKKYYEKVFLP